jgi:uncharacterized protein (TIGR02246 family)
MKSPRQHKFLSGVVLACVGIGLMDESRAQETIKAPTAGAGLSQRPQDEAAIKQVAGTFTRAFNAGDATTVASLYTDDAEVIDEYEEKIQGRRSIQEFYSAIFAERKGATIEIALETLRFLGPDAAQETGQTRVKPAGDEAATVRDYTVLYVKQGGRWLYSSVREEFPDKLAHHERLKELEWMIGEWVDENSNSLIHMTCRWSDDKNYLLRDFLIHVQGKPVLNVTQRIGWDPVSKQIKSWVFDSDGGYADALWARDGTRWVIKSSGVLPDGQIVTATNVLTRTGPNAARWASTDRTVGGRLIPNPGESIMVRKPPQPQSHSQPR